jgi:hypothetical protein
VRDTEGGVRGGWIALGGFVAGVALALVFGLAASAVDAPGDDLDLVLVASQLGLWTGLLGACVLAGRRHETGGLRGLGFAMRWRDLWIGGLAGLVARIGSIVIAIPFVPLLRDERAPESPIFESDVSYTAVTVLVLAIMVAVLTPIVEELYFRGLVQGVLTRRWGGFVAIFVQAGLFAVVHLAPGMSAVRIAFTLWIIGVTGVFLGALRWYFRRLGPSIVAHGVFNALALALFLAID